MPPKLDAAPQEGKEVKATVSVRNTGKEPALDFVWSLRALIATANELENGVIDRMASEYVSACFKTRSQRRNAVLDRLQREPDRQSARDALGRGRRGV